MSRAKGTANLAASLEVLAGAPLDAREKVPTKADLYLAANFPYPYVGLETYVVSENKKYRLIGNDVTVEANWQEVGSGGGGGTTVVANPEGTATDELEKLQVGNDIYSIPQGGGGADTEIIADDFDPTESYAVGAYVVYEGTLYKCTTAHTGAWDVSDFDATQVMEEMPTPMPAADMSDIVNPLPGVMSRRHKYSTEEQVVGTWIDGKPVYEKVIIQTDYNINSSWKYVSTGIVNLGEVVELKGTFAKSESGTDIYSLSYGGGESFISLVIDKSNDKIAIKSGESRTGKLIVVIKYTKTTD